MERPIFSIITVTYNCEKYIDSTMDSFAVQTLDKIYWETIFIDGDSSDETLHKIKSNSFKPDIIVSESDFGIFDAMNKGLSKARGLWVIFINAGDKLFSKTTLEEVYDEVKNLKDVAIVYGNTFSNSKIEKPKKIESLKYGFMPVCHQSILFNSKILNEELYYRTKYNIGGDIELFRRLWLKGYQQQYINTTVSNYLGDGISSKKSWEARKSKFEYLYDHYKIKGFLYGALGKLKYLINEY